MSANSLFLLVYPDGFNRLLSLVEVSSLMKGLSLPDSSLLSIHDSYKKFRLSLSLSDNYCTWQFTECDADCQAKY